MRYKKQDTTIYTAVLHLSMIEYLFFCGVTLLINSILYPQELLLKYLLKGISQGVVNLCVLFIGFALILINYFYYKKKVLNIEEKYRSCNYNKWVKAWMFFVFDLVLLLIAILIFKLRRLYNV